MFCLKLSFEIVKCIHFNIFGNYKNWRPTLFILEKKKLLLIDKIKVL